MTPFSDEIISRARGGDPAALDELAEEIVHWVLAVVYAKKWKPLDPMTGPEDIAQEVTRHAIDKLNTYRGQAAQAFRKWLRSILENYLRDVARHATAEMRDRRETDSLQDPLPGGPETDPGTRTRLDTLADPKDAEEARQQETVRLVKEFLRSYPNQMHARVAELSWMEDLSYQEITQVLPGLTKENVGSILSRMRPECWKWIKDHQKR